MSFLSHLVFRDKVSREPGTHPLNSIGWTAIPRGLPAFAFPGLWLQTYTTALGILTWILASNWGLHFCKITSMNLIPLPPNPSPSILYSGFLSYIRIYKYSKDPNWLGICFPRLLLFSTHWLKSSSGWWGGAGFNHRIQEAETSGLSKIKVHLHSEFSAIQACTMRPCFIRNFIVIIAVVII